MLTTRRRLALFALAIAVPLALSACGRADTSTAARIKAAIKAEILTSEQTRTADDSPYQLNDPQADCFAGDLVDHIGAIQLKKDGVIGKGDRVTQAITSSSLTLPPADAGTFVSALFDCTDGGGQVVTRLRTELTSQMRSLPASAKTCINAKLDAGLIRKILVATLSGQGQDQIRAQVTQITEGCVPGVG